MQGQTAFIWLGILTMVIGYPLWRRWVPRNRWYGLRIAATFADALVWYEANAAVGRDLMVLGAGLLGLALLLPRVSGMSPGWYAILCLGPVVVWSLVSLSRASRRATQLLSERRESLP